VAETVYTLMLASTSYVVSAGAVHAIRAAAATGRESVRVVPIGQCTHCFTPHTVVDIRVSDVRAVVRHDSGGTFAQVSASAKVVPLKKYATG